MVMGLKEGTPKMSKSDPQSAVFMEDTEAEVNQKIKAAFCPIGKVEENPVLDYVKHIILPARGFLDVERADEHGGRARYCSFENLANEFAALKVLPKDLKTSVASAINELIQPVREHFEKDSYARRLLANIKQWQREELSGKPAK
jgi:tyrosyl-tRNA synthetase